jgi:uncharacterized membrane protein YfhO
MVLSLKVTVFVYDNFNSLEFSSEKISMVDFEDTEGEEKESDEQKKIVQQIKNNNSSSLNSNKSNNNYMFDNYNITYLEYTTPPPEQQL